MRKLKVREQASLVGGEASAGECFLWGVAIGASVGTGNVGAAAAAGATALARGCAS